MTVKLTRFEIKNYLEETGEDITNIALYFSTETSIESIVPYFFGYDKLLHFIGTIDIEAYQYLIKIRNNLGGYGFKHSQIFKIITEEGFDIVPFINLYFESLDKTLLQQHIEWEQNLKNQSGNTAITLKNLESHFTPKKIEKNKNKYIYLEEIDQAIHEITLRFFPEIINQDAAFLQRYKSIIVNTTLRFAENIDKLVNK